MSYSVVIPAYNAERTIEACLASVFSQTLAPLEVIVIDDCSTDKTESIARAWQTRFAAAGIGYKYLKQIFNQGPSAARNRGVFEAGGAFIAFLDADDIWMEEKLALINLFAAKSRAGLICHMYSESSPLESSPGASLHSRRLRLWQLLIKNPAQTSCVVMRRSPARKFSENMRYCEDYDLWLQIAESDLVIQLLGHPLTRLGRPQLSEGGLSGNRWRMRVGEMVSYYNFCSRSWFPRALLLPILLACSATKHLWQETRRLMK